MENNVRNNKVIGEREKMRQMFIERARNPQIPNPFDPQSMAEWEGYCEEMRGYEMLLAEM